MHLLICFHVVLAIPNATYCWKAMLFSLSKEKKAMLFNLIHLQRSNLRLVCIFLVVDASFFSFHDPVF